MSTSGPDRSIIRKKKELEDRLVQMGYPEVFGRAIANQLGTMKTMNRMLAYLEKANPGSAEEIADEMLAICEERFQWQFRDAVSRPSKPDGGLICGEKM